MLVTFSSKAGADILMLAQHAKPLLKIIGKTDDKDLMSRGVFMPGHLQDAIARLEQAIAAEPRQTQDDDQETDHPKDALSLPVGLRQRSFPLLDLLKRAQAQQVPVMWEAGSSW
ncbi:DUF1840 domain-containing protein [Zwartia panacis]|uniref:DUF1840 domain-containing protein n=1 Tax=Zwartia panacis TaxID=2683345 RepID=UPI0025B343F4|nr:DUF1840 domain-containing protein [Zwartia panacis]MDN4017046.1 DUF1840 domain-containing protein [Zwartia panacis]